MLFDGGGFGDGCWKHTSVLFQLVGDKSPRDKAGRCERGVGGGGGGGGGSVG